MADPTLEVAQQAARDIGLCVLAHLKADLSDLGRIKAWARVFGMVSSAPGFTRQHLLINGFSDLMINVFGPEVGHHARSAIGAAALPMSVIIEIEVETVLA